MLVAAAKYLRLVAKLLIGTEEVNLPRCQELAGPLSWRGVKPIREPLIARQLCAIPPRGPLKRQVHKGRVMLLNCLNPSDLTGAPPNSPDHQDLVEQRHIGVVFVGGSAGLISGSGWIAF